MYYIIANPNAGTGKGKIVFENVRKYLDENKIKYKAFLTEYEEHSIDLTHIALAEGARMIIAIGGDGTFMEVATAIGDRDDVAIGFIPAGNGNDFAYSAGISNDEIVALEGILKNEATELDYIKCNGVKCLNACGTGLDTEVLQKYMKMPKRGRFSYVKCLLKVLLKFDYHRLKINIDNLQTIVDDYMLVSCCNGKRFGAKIMICKDADMEDSLMDLVVIKKFPKWKIPFLLLTFLRGNHLNKKWCTHIKCKYAKVEKADGSNMTINVDGQLFETNKMEAEIKPCKLLCLNQ